MSRHLLDSDILIWVLRGRAEAISFVTDLLKNEIPAISSLTVYEIWAGARPSEEAAISSFLSAFRIVPVNVNIARQGAEYHKQFRRKGMTLSSTDALIAATARTEQLILVTQNRRHFPMPDLDLRGL
jgi:predicted nucleic acid-binding protein